MGIKNGDVTLDNVIVGDENDPIDLFDEPEVNYSVGDQYRRLAYTYNQLGFITSRSDSKVEQTETYVYDNLDRLIRCSVNSSVIDTFWYGANGNITANTKVGIYSYSINKPHAVTCINGTSARTPSPDVYEISYNLRNKPISISKNTTTVSLDYDGSGVRRHMQITNGQTVIKQKVSISSLYEKETVPTERHLDYIYADGKVVAIHVMETNSESLYYLLTDHLGSWNMVMDEDKNIVQQTHFDPWGNRMTYTDWSLPQTQTTFTFDRGFTGHEHYDRVNVINMNARLYDPVIGRFFSPDPFVQAPDFTQAFNRYSYCMNNPVMYSDPTGEFLGIPMLGLAFIADLTSNLINGVDHPVQTAWKNAYSTVTGMDQCLQFSVSLGENTALNFGISPLSISVNAGFSYYNGSNSVSFGGGYGIMNGPFGYMYGSQDIGFANVNIGFGIGNNYYGWNTSITRNGYGVGYGKTFYGNSNGPDGNPNPQITGTPSIYFGNGSFRLENDYFGDRHDRWRTNAWELSVGSFTLGSTIYTNNPEEMGYGHPNDRPSPLFGLNNPTSDYDYGAWKPGYVYSCPLWFGWKHGNNISRIGYRHPIFQDATQNFVHKYFPYGRMNFYLDYDYFYKGIYLDGGYNNPFSLY